MFIKRGNPSGWLNAPFLSHSQVTGGLNLSYGAVGAYPDSVNSYGLVMGATWQTAYNPVLLDGVEVKAFEATFALKRTTTTSSSCSGKFIFNATDSDDYDAIAIAHADTRQGLYGVKSEDGNPEVSVSGTSIPANVPSATQNDILWYRVTNTGTRVSVKCLKKNTGAPTEAEWAAAGECYYSTSFNNTAGKIGFTSTYYYPTIDDLTLKTDQNADGVFETTEYATSFTVNAQGYATDSNAYDANGNETYDGTYVYRYDAWNHLVATAHGYRDDGGVLHTGSTFDTYSYDAAGRRIAKVIATGTYLDGTEAYYYDGTRQVEVRNASNQTIKQQVWGTQYVDQLVTISINTNPATDNTCETQYWVAQDSNYDVIGIVDSTGKLIERYEYSPYGKRTVYFSPGVNDNLLMASTFMSRRVGSLSFGLCEFGSQGLYMDEETGLYYNDARYRDPETGRFKSIDPKLYIDGMNPYVIEGRNPVNGLDPTGMSWDTIDFVDHYYDQSGSLVDLSQVGLLNVYRGAPSVASQVDTAKRNVLKDIRERGRKLYLANQKACKPVTEHIAGKMPNMTVNVVEQIFIMGQGVLKGTYDFTLELRCCADGNRPGYAYSGTFHFWSLDAFRDPLCGDRIGALSGGIVHPGNLEAGGMPYSIYVSWDEAASGEM